MAANGGTGAGGGGNGGSGSDGSDGWVVAFPGIESSGHRRFIADRDITWPGVTDNCMAVLHGSDSEVVHKRAGTTRATHTGPGIMEITDLDEDDTLEVSLPTCRIP